MEEEFGQDWVTESETDEANEEMFEEVDDDIIEEEYLVGEEIIPTTGINAIANSLDQIAAENLIYMAQDGNTEFMGDLIEEQVEQADNADYNEHQYFDCQEVTEEVITDDWVQQQGEERVEIPVDQIGHTNQIDQDLDVPLPTDPDEYTTSRPYPCDFCSRRFRKKTNLMNHMIAHKNDRPHICNLCGARYIRRHDLLTHLKVHAQVPDSDVLLQSSPRKETKGRKAPKSPKKRKIKLEEPKQEFNEDDVQLVMEVQQQQEEQEQRYPVIDPTRPFVCQKCGVSFAREKALLSHSKMHGGDSIYECDSCSEIFWDLQLFREHQKLQHAGADSNSEYEPENERDYSDSETDSKYGDFYCNVCGMSFHRPDLLRRHTKTHIKHDYGDDVHTTTQHCCNVCGESFIEALDLLAHAEVHARSPFKCMLCGETFLDEMTIKKHILNVHDSEINENTCKLCGKKCRDNKSLMKHSWEHSTEKNHSCSMCGKTFHNKARLKRHMQSHRNKSVTCDKCGDDFPDGRSLMNHRHSHTNVSGRQFPCKECGKTFGSRSSQQIHTRIHTGERPYGCRFCWKAFADGGTLRKHERIHTGEKPYACPVCPRAFNQRVVLREHIRSHHSGPDTKNGSTMTPFYCTVCTDLFATSSELIQHLIEHSDMNTAMKRQPPTGPRKYKRRRKLKPHELERLRNEHIKSDYSDDEAMNQSTNYEDGYENEYGMVDIMKPQQIKREPIKRETTKIKSPSMRDTKMSSSFNDNFINPFNSIVSDLQSIDSLVVPSCSNSSISNSKPVKNNKPNARKRSSKPESQSQHTSRPKMIHTQKMRVPVEDGKRKTRTLITRTSAKDVHETTPVRISKRNEKKRKSSNHYVKDDMDLLLESSRKHLKFPEVVNDLEEIFRSPIKSRESNDEYITSDVPPPTVSKRTSKRNSVPTNRYGAEKRSSTGAKLSKSIDLPLADPLNIKIEAEASFDDVFTCEMCSAVFRDRSQLLDHVPVHI